MPEEKSALDSFLDSIAGGITKISKSINEATKGSATAGNAGSQIAFTPRSSPALSDSALGLGLLVLVLVVFSFMD